MTNLIPRLILMFVLWLAETILQLLALGLFLCLVSDNIRNSLDDRGQMLLLGAAGVCILLVASIHGVRQLTGGK
jgi:hypothetical protein